jgi:hypothetical protein
MVAPENKEADLSRNGNGGSLPGLNYTSLELSQGQRREQQQREALELQKAFEEFLAKHPEMAADPRKIETLHYCFRHYVNFDPEMRDLSIQEKLERSGRMALDFLGSMAKF